MENSKHHDSRIDIDKRIFVSSLGKISSSPSFFVGREKVLDMLKVALLNDGMNRSITINALPCVDSKLGFIPLFSNALKVLLSTSPRSGARVTFFLPGHPGDFKKSRNVLLLLDNGVHFGPNLSAQSILKQWSSVEKACNRIASWEYIAFTVSHVPVRYEYSDDDLRIENFRDIGQVYYDLLTRDSFSDADGDEVERILAKAELDVELSELISEIDCSLAQREELGDASFNSIFERRVERLMQKVDQAWKRIEKIPSLMSITREKIDQRIEQLIAYYYKPVPVVTEVDEWLNRRIQTTENRPPGVDSWDVVTEINEWLNHWIQTTENRPPGVDSWDVHDDLRIESFRDISQAYYDLLTRDSFSDADENEVERILAKAELDVELSELISEIDCSLAQREKLGEVSFGSIFERRARARQATRLIGFDESLKAKRIEIDLERTKTEEFLNCWIQGIEDRRPEVDSLDVHDDLWIESLQDIGQAYYDLLARDSFSDADGDEVERILAKAELDVELSELISEIDCSLAQREELGDVSFGSIFESRARAQQSNKYKGMLDEKILRTLPAISAIPSEASMQVIRPIRKQEKLGIWNLNRFVGDEIIPLENPLLVGDEYSDDDLLIESFRSISQAYYDLLARDLFSDADGDEVERILAKAELDVELSELISEIDCSLAQREELGDVSFGSIFERWVRVRQEIQGIKLKLASDNATSMFGNVKSIECKNSQPPVSPKINQFDIDCLKFNWLSRLKVEKSGFGLSNARKLGQHLWAVYSSMHSPKATSLPDSKSFVKDSLQRKNYSLYLPLQLDRQEAINFDFLSRKSLEIQYKCPRITPEHKKLAMMYLIALIKPDFCREDEMILENIISLSETDLILGNILSGVEKMIQKYSSNASDCSL
jgi:hypothetical protein